MVSEVTIVNKALFHLGEPRLTSIFPPEKKKSARFYNENYVQVREECLADFPWSFACEKATPNLLASPPTSEYLYVYQLPTSPKVLKIRRLLDGTDLSIDLKQPYKKRGDLLHTNVTGGFYVEYTKDVEDENEFTPEFIEAFALKLALVGCFYLTKDRQRENTLYQMYTMKLMDARDQDIEGTQPRPIRPTAWNKVGRV